MGLDVRVVSGGAPNIFDRYREFVEEGDYGDTVELLKLGLGPNERDTELEDLALAVMNDVDVVQSICVESDTGRQGYDGRKQRLTTREQAAFKIQNIFDVMGWLCTLSSRFVVGERLPHMTERLEVSLALFKEITKEQYCMCAACSTACAWLDFQTYPMCSTFFVHNSIDAEMWLVLWNNRNL